MEPRSGQIHVAAMRAALIRSVPFARVEATEYLQGSQLTIALNYYFAIQQWYTKENQTAAVIITYCCCYNYFETQINLHVVLNLRIHEFMHIVAKRKGTPWSHKARTAAKP